jgi:ferredoxin-NADP reductase
MSTSPLFHDLIVRRIESDTTEAVIVTFEVPVELRESFGFTQGQYLTLRKTMANCVGGCARSRGACSPIGSTNIFRLVTASV